MYNGFAGINHFYMFAFSETFYWSAEIATKCFWHIINTFYRWSSVALFFGMSTDYKGEGKISEMMTSSQQGAKAAVAMRYKSL